MAEAGSPPKTYVRGSSNLNGSARAANYLKVTSEGVFLAQVCAVAAMIITRVGCDELERRGKLRRMGPALRKLAWILVPWLAMNASARQPVVEKVKAWAEKEIERARATSLEGLAYTVVVEDSDSVSADQLAAMEKEIEGKPDHPLRARVEVLRRRMTKGPDRQRQDNWIGRGGDVRHNTTYEKGASALPFDDVARHGNIIWLMTPGQICLLDSKGPYPSGRDYTGELTRASRVLASAIFGPFGSIVDREMKLTAARATEKGAELVYDDDKEVFQYRLSVDWSAAEQRGVIGKCETWWGPSRQGIGKAWETTYADWSDLGVRGLRGARSITAVSSEDGAIQKSVIEHVREVSDQELASVLAVPSFAAKADAVRGPYTFTSVHDLRRDRGVIVTGRDGATTTKRSAEAIAEPRVDHTLRVAGWAGVAAIVAAVVIARVRRGRSGETSGAPAAPRA